MHFYKHDAEGAEMAAGIMRGLRFSNALVERVSFLVREHMRFKPFGNDVPPDKAIRKFQYLCGDRDTFRLCLCLIHADNLSHAEGHCLPDQCVLMMKRSGELERCGEAMFGYKPPLDGHDIMRIRGVSGGAEVGACLEYLVRLAYNGVRRLDKTECTKLAKGFNPDKN